MNTAIPDNFRRMISNLSDSTSLDGEALLRALDSTPAVGIRFNRRKAAPDEYSNLYPDMSPIEWCDDGRRLAERPLFAVNPLLHAGVFYVQDPSSMIYQQVISHIAKLARQPLTLLDFCAAPGGKTTAIINALPDSSMVVANEYVAARGKILRENLEKWGFPNVITTGNSSSDYRRLTHTFDIIAVDAPCSGEGMMRKDDDARRQWSPTLTRSCAQLQQSILADVVGALKPGGWLIYSTCTFNTDENERNAAFIRDSLGLQPVSLPLSGIDCASTQIIGDIPALRFMPHLTEGEGLFIAIFQKPEGDITPIRHRSVTKRTKNSRCSQPKQNVSISWIDSDATPVVSADGKIVSALPDAMMPLLNELQEAGLNITAAGLPVARLAGRDFVPDSRVALSSLMRPDAFPVIEMSLDDALRYLHRESLALPTDTPRGFVIVSYNGHPLGLVKNLGNRANNLLPEAWRLKTV